MYANRHAHSLWVRLPEQNTFQARPLIPLAKLFEPLVKLLYFVVIPLRRRIVFVYQPEGLVDSAPRRFRWTKAYLSATVE